MFNPFSEVAESGSVDVESTDDLGGSDFSGDESGLRASSLDGIDLFE